MADNKEHIEITDEILENLSNSVDQGRPPLFYVYAVVYALITGVVLTIFAFFGYKLYKSLVDRERRKEEKRKQKQQKKKK